MTEESDLCVYGLNAACLGVAIDDDNAKFKILD